MFFIIDNRLKDGALAIKMENNANSNLLAFLKKEEGKYLKLHKATKSEPGLFHVCAASSYEAFKLLAGSGTLLFNGKQLVIDLFGKADFYYEVNEVEARVRILGRIKSGDLDIPVQECDMVGAGPPHYFIKGIRLKFIHTELSWKELKSAWEGNTLLSQEIIENAQESQEAPQIVYAGKAKALLEQKQEPLPILQLKDRQGAFADLWMDYGEHGKIAYHDASVPFNRLIESERNFEKDLLETDFIKKWIETSHYYCPTDKIGKSLQFLLEIGWKIFDWKGNQVNLQSDMNVYADEDQYTISIKGQIHYSTFQADLSQVIGAFNRRDRFIQLAPGHIGLLPENLDNIGLSALSEEGEIVGDSIRVNKNRIGALSELFESRSINCPFTLQDLHQKIHTFQGIENALPGASFIGNLRPYQQEGVNWLSFLHKNAFHGILADDMGLGKTVQVLAFLSRLSPQLPILIVVPTSLIFNWKHEIQHFLARWQCFIYHGKEREQWKETESPTIVLTTYSILRRDLSFFMEKEFACIIIDEAQAIKNEQSQTSQSVKKIKAQFRLAVTGTPIENHLGELWSIFEFLLPGLLGEESAFRSEIEAGRSDFRFLKRIKRKIRPFLLRRKKEDVAKDLPEKIEQVVWIDMEEGQRQIYENFLSGVRRGLIQKIHVDGFSKHRMEILEAILRLRQICCHPLLVNNENAESAKLEALMADVETVLEEKHKVLVYSQFTSMLKVIGKNFKERAWPYLYLDGMTTDREKVVSQFQEDPAMQLFLISLKAGGVGLNLTQADYVFLYDPWWNEAVENQAIDRAHRIGRKNPVIAKRYIIAESIEEKMMKIKEAKRSLAAELVDDEALGRALNEDDFLYLLS